MGFRSDYESASDQWGLVLPPGADSSGNGVRYTSEAVLAAVKHGELTESWRQYFISVFAKVEHPSYPGLLMRTPDNGYGYQSVDDTVGALTASYYLQNGFAARWLKHGRFGAIGIDGQDPNAEKVALSKKVYIVLCLLHMSARVPYVFNNRNPQKFAVASWLGRQPHVVAHAQFAAGEKPALWRKLWWCASVISSVWATHPDAWVLTCHLVKVAKGKSWLCDLAAKFWRRAFRKRYPHGMGEALHEYWGDHPNTRYLQDEFGE